MAIHTVLCIEDDRFIGEMYVRSLKKAGYDVDWVVDGNDGLITARNKQYDLILLDVMLPERRGTDILKALALGADAVAIGRLEALAMAAGGAGAVVRALELLEVEMRLNLQLMGLSSIEQLTPDCVLAAEPVGLPHTLSAFPLLDEDY